MLIELVWRRSVRIQFGKLPLVLFDLRLITKIGFHGNDCCSVAFYVLWLWPMLERRTVFLILSLIAVCCLALSVCIFPGCNAMLLKLNNVV